MLPSIMSLIIAGIPLPFDKLVAHSAQLTRDDLYSIASTSAEHYGLTETQNLKLHRVVQCESDWIATSTGELGERGLAQIYPVKHPTITETEMIDPYFALDFLAKNLYKHPSWWTCYALVR